MKTTLIAKRITGSKNGKDYDFLSFRTAINEEWMTAKFTKAVTNLPTVEGNYTIELFEGSYNVNTKEEYPVVWIKKLDSITTK